MQVVKLDEMTKGWFVGDFSPTCFRTGTCEVACKRYREGERESSHHHKIATELTVVVSGRICMGGRELLEGDIAIISPGESTDFLAVTDAVTIVVKVPCVKGDKYID